MTRSPAPIQIRVIRSGEVEVSSASETRYPANQLGIRAMIASALDCAEFPLDLSVFPVSPISAHQIIPENYHLAKAIRPDQDGVRFLELLPHDACNHDCSWCFTKQIRDANVLGAASARKVLELFASQGGASVLFSGGGEPLLAKYLSIPSADFDGLTAPRWLADRGISVGLITNGVHLKRYLQHNVETFSNAAFVRVSLDACNALEYRRTHNADENDFAKVLDGIEHLISLRGISRTPAVGISFVLGDAYGLDTSASAIRSIATLARQLNVDFVQLKHVHTSEAASADQNMREVFDHCLGEDWEDTEYWVHRYALPKPSQDCHVASVSRLIGAAGHSHPCCHRQDMTIPPQGLLPSKTYNIIKNCGSEVCRYVSLNEQLLSSMGRDANRAAHNTAHHKLFLSLRQHGYHPYRLFPSAPDLFGYTNLNDCK